MVMLIPKPIILAIKHKFSHKGRKSIIIEDNLKEQFLENPSELEYQNDPNREKEEEHEISEIFVH